MHASMYQINFQRPKRNVSVGALDEIKPDLLANVRYAMLEGQEQWYHRRAQLVDGQVMAGDESHKITKSIRVTDAKAFQGVYTMLNEFNLVVLQVDFFFFPSSHASISIRAYLSRSGP